MDEARRLRYLEAMGIDVWLPIAERLPGTTAVDAAGLSDSRRELERVGKETDANLDRAEHFGQDSFEISAADAVLQTATDDVLFETSLSEVESAKAAMSAHSECGDASSPDPAAGMDWETLQQSVAQCRKCGLCETRTQTVFGSGNRKAEWMLIGEAPGQQEDLQGEPFVGKAGQLLTEMLRAMGLTREEVYITNVVKCRPPNNRDPKPEEMAACSVYLRRQIELVRPKMILAVGRIAAQHLLQTDAPLAKLRGKVHFLGEIPLIVIYHPAYLLRSLLEKRKAWEDLQMALRVFRESC